MTAQQLAGMAVNDNEYMRRLDPSFYGDRQRAAGREKRKKIIIP
jgi:hypothetical protein